MAVKTGAELGREVRPDCLRQWLARARARSSDLFLEEPAEWLEDADPDSLEGELIELGLLERFRPALRRRRSRDESILEG